METVTGYVHIDVAAPDGVPAFDTVDAFVTRLGEIEDSSGAAIQALDARYVAGPEHVERAVALATRARDRNDTIARDRAVEILLYAAGRRQIERALTMGVGPGRTPAVVVIDGGEECTAAAAVAELLEPGDTYEAADPDRIRSFFDIDDAELAATDAGLSALVRERVALLVVEK